MIVSKNTCVSRDNETYNTIPFTFIWLQFQLSYYAHNKNITTNSYKYGSVIKIVSIVYIM